MKEKSLNSYAFNHKRIEKTCIFNFGAIINFTGHSMTKIKTKKLKYERVDFHVRLQVCSTFCTRLFPKLRKQTDWERLCWVLENQSRSAIQMQVPHALAGFVKSISRCPGSLPYMQQNCFNLIPSKMCSVQYKLLGKNNKLVLLVTSLFATNS